VGGEAGHKRQGTRRAHGMTGRACMASPATPCALDDTTPCYDYLSLLALLLPNLSLIAYRGHSQMPSPPTATDTGRQTRPTLTHSQNNDTHAFGQRRVLPLPSKPSVLSHYHTRAPLLLIACRRPGFCVPFAGLLCRRGGGGECVPTILTACCVRASSLPSCLLPS